MKVGDFFLLASLAPILRTDFHISVNDQMAKYLTLTNVNCLPCFQLKFRKPSDLINSSRMKKHRISDYTLYESIQTILASCIKGVFLPPMRLKLFFTIFFSYKFISTIAQVQASGINLTVTIALW